MDVKLFIHKKEIYIGDTKKGEAISPIFCFITSSEDTRFQASSKGKAIINDSSEKDDTKYENGDSSEEKSNEILSDQDF